MASDKNPDLVPLPHPCFEPTNTGFFEPTSSSIYKLGDVIDISWYGGRNIQGTPTQSFTVYMKRYRDFSSDGNSTVPIVTDEPFTYGEDDGSSSWSESVKVPGGCVYSAFHYQWAIPSTLKLMSDNDFILVAQNVTDDDDETDYITSDPFLIETDSSSATTSFTSSSSSTASTKKPDSTATGSPIPSLAVSKSLSTGSKAGIGVGVALAAVLLLVGFWLFWRKRSQKKSVAPAGSTTGYEKAELAGKSLDKLAVEAGGTEVMEADGTEVNKVDEAQIIEPIELPSQQFK